MENATTVTPQIQVTLNKRKQKIPDPVFPEHKRGGEAKSIGELMQPLHAIISHPNRNRLLAQFCKDIDFLR